VKKQYIFVALFVLVGVAAVAWMNAGKRNTQPTACTMEAKLCPDGSAVGRTGPNCEFAACPEAGTPLVEEGTKKDAGAAGTVTGTVTLSPICPVERIPPEPQCAPKPYQTKIDVFTTDGTELVKTIQTGADGRFSATLPRGDYSFQAGGGIVMPRCSPVEVHVQATISTVDISCDTGIR
jgi:hypothetical protein